jgi:DNA polymerase-3 subunit delta'
MMAGNNTGPVELLPWQISQWRDLQARLGYGTLPHALLLRGPEGLGKARFAHYLALSLLCRDKGADGAPCGHCRGCTLNRAATHPDLITIGIAPEKKEIHVNQIRDLIDVLSLKPQYGEYKIIIITPADALNHNAANSLLKTLEEPPPGTLLLLCSNQPATLPATIRSRCQQVVFQRPPSALARKWLVEQLPEQTAEHLDVLLNIADGAPLKSIQLASADPGHSRQTLLVGLEQLLSGQANPSKIAEEWLKLGAKDSLYWLYSWIADMIRLGMTKEQPALISNTDARNRLAALVNGIDNKRLFQHLDKTGQALKLLDQQINQQLMLEELLIGWYRKN